MAWLHCSIRDGSVVALSRNKGFDPEQVSEAMEKEYFHIRVKGRLRDLKHLCDAVEDDAGEIIHKFKGVVDIDTQIPAEERVNIRDRTKRVKPFGYTDADEGGRVRPERPDVTIAERDIKRRKKTDEPTVRRVTR